MSAFFSLSATFSLFSIKTTSFTLLNTHLFSPLSTPLSLFLPFKSPQSRFLFFLKIQVFFLFYKIIVYIDFDHLKDHIYWIIISFFLLLSILQYSFLYIFQIVLDTKSFFLVFFFIFFNIFNLYIFL